MKVSVIITTKNEEKNIENCLKSIKNQTYPQDRIEIIVVDNDSVDRTKEIALRYTDKVYDWGPERSAQRNFGVRQAKGKYILYLDADMMLSQNIIFECVEKCENDENLVALYIPEKIIGSSFWCKVRDFERSFYNATAIDCVRFVRRDKFLELGGFDENLTGPEDWDFDRRIREIGKVDVIKSPIYHNEARFNLKEYLNKKRYYARSFNRYIQKWNRGDAVIKKQLGFWYRYFEVFMENGKWKRLIIHPIFALGMYTLRFLVGLNYLKDILITKITKERKLKSQNGVLILSPFFRPNIGGVETHLDDLCEYLREHGYMVYVLTYQPLTTKAKGPWIERKENLEIRRIPWFGHNWFHKLEPYPMIEFLYLVPALFMYTLFFLLKNAKNINIIHAHGLNAAFIVSVVNKIFNFKKRTAVSIHAIYHLERKKILGKLFKFILINFDKILVPSQKSKDELTKIGLPENKIKIATQWVNQTIFRPLDKTIARRQLGLNDSNFIVLFVGRLIEKKGVRILLEIASEIEIPDIQFIFIGDGPLEEEVYTKSLYNKKILYNGKKTKELPLYYNAADIVIIPSLYEEVFGRVILEALSCGTPVVGANRGDIPNKINSSVGYIIESTKKNIKDILYKLYEDKFSLFKKRTSCRYYAEQNFSIRNAELIEKAYVE